MSSVQEHRPPHPVVCATCGSRVSVLVQLYDALKVHDPMCRACFEAQDVASLRRPVSRIIGPNGRANRDRERRRRKAPEVLRPKELN